MSPRDPDVRIHGRLGIRAVLAVAVVMLLASAVLVAATHFSQRVRAERREAELRRVTAMAEVYAAQIAGAIGSPESDVVSLVQHGEWHPASRLLAVFEVDGRLRAVRGDRQLLAACLQLGRGCLPNPTQGRWYLPGDARLHRPATAVAGVPICHAGGNLPLGTLVYAVRAEAGLGVTPAPLRHWSVPAVLASGLGLFLAVCLLRHSLLEPLGAVVRKAGGSDAAPRTPLDEVGAVATLLDEMQQHLQESRTRVDELERAVDRRVQDETHKMSLQLRQVERKAWMDPLTKLGNRLLLDERFEALFDEQRRVGDSLSLIMMDVDYFKTLNDTLGHKAGDELIAFIGELLGQCVREKDMAVRYGGDEFLLVLPGTSAAEAAAVAERVVRLFGQRTRLLPYDPKPSMSAGVASLTEHKPASAAAFIQMADNALYQAKSAGKARVCVYRPGCVMAPKAAR